MTVADALHPARQAHAADETCMNVVGFYLRSIFPLSHLFLLSHLLSYDSCLKILLFPIPAHHHHASLFFGDSEVHKTLRKMLSFMEV